MMTRAEFQRALQRHGADLAVWPPYIRRQAQESLLRSREARATYLKALDLDASLAGAPAPAEAARLLQTLGARIAAAAQAPPPLRWSAWQASALLACAALGAIAGTQIGRPPQAFTQVAALTNLMAADDLP